MSSKPEKLSNILLSLFSSTEEEEISVQKIVSNLDHHGIAMILILFSIPAAVPLPAAGYSTILAIPLYVMAFRLIAGFRTVWLPTFVSKKTIKTSTLKAAVEKIIGVVKFLEKFSKPRLSRFVGSTTVYRLIGIIIFLLASSMLLPIPGTNTAPAFGIFLLGFGLLEEDGLVILIGSLASLVALAISGAIIYGVLYLGIEAKEGLSGLL